MKPKNFLTMMLLLFALIAGSMSAWATDETISIDISSFTDLPSSGNATYKTYNWSEDGVSGKATICANHNSTNMQFNASNYLFYNTSAIPGTIKSIKMTTASGTDRTYEVYGSTSAYSGSGTSYGTEIGSQTVTTSGTTFTVSSGSYAYFTIVKTGSGAGYISSIEVTYTPAGGGSNLEANDLTLNATEKIFDLNDEASLTFQLTNSGHADGALSFVSNNADVATVTNTGLITAVSEGTATITVTQAPTDTYDGGTANCTVTVIDSRYTVSNLTFTEACGGSGTADDGAKWTVTSDGTESNFIDGAGIHYGTSSAFVQYVELRTSDIDDQVSKVVVNARDAQEEAAITVTVGGVDFTCSGNASATATNTSTDYTFTGTGSGGIVVRIDRGESMTKAIYVKSVKVSYLDADAAVKAPVIYVASEFMGSTTATITCNTDGATIYYSYDNSTWNVYTTALTITATTTIYAKAVKDSEESKVVSRTTTKILPTPTVTINAAGITNTNVFTGTAAGTLAATVTYNNAVIEGATVTWSGNSHSVATINAETGAVTLVDDGSVVFTATYAGKDGEYNGATATYTMTVTNVDPDPVTLWSEDFSSYADGDNPAGGEFNYECVPGSSSSYTKVCSETYAGGSKPELLVGKSTGSFTATIPLDCMEGNLILTFKTNAHKIYVSSQIVEIKGEANFNSAGEHTVTFKGVTPDMTFVDITFAAGSENVRLDDILLTGSNAKPRSVTITNAEYATYCNATNALDFSGTGIKVFTATDNENSVKLNEITSGQVPADTPVILYKADADGTAINVPVIASADAIEGTNDLHVVGTGGLTNVDNIFVLAKNPTVGFYLWDKTKTLNEGKIYLQGKDSYTTTARQFLGFDEGTTAINAVEISNVENKTFYNLAGQRVAQPTKGLYIVNGKKYIVK